MKDVIRRVIANALILCAFGTASFARQQTHKAQQESPGLKLSTELVSLNVLVTDRSGNAITGLEEKNFQVYENGVEQTITFFSTDDAAVSWGLVLDRSGSMQQMITDVYQAALHVMDDGTDQDEMFIVTFNKRAEMVSDFTTNRNVLQNSIIGLRADGSTALYDAVAFALNQIRHARREKKVLVVVTDGDDNSSRVRFRDLVERAKEEQVLIYTIGMFGSMNSMLPRRDEVEKANFPSAAKLGTTQHLGPPLLRVDFVRKDLERLAEVTGSSAHFPTNLSECKEAMTAIAVEVSRQYAIGYYPSNTMRDGKWCKIKVKAVGAASKRAYVARTRAGYYAPKIGGVE